MSGNAFNYLALLAALVVGYGVFVSTSDGETTPGKTGGVIQGYYLQNAVITETTAEGKPHFRVAAAEVTQNSEDGSYALAGLRVDYLKPESKGSGAEDQGAHWVLNSDRGTALNNFRRLVLQGNVEAHNLGAPRAIVLDTHSLQIDMDNETAQSTDAVQIGLDHSIVTGHGFYADLNRERFVLESQVGLKLAQVNRPTLRPGDEETEIQVPESFEAKSSAYDGSILTMTDVASKSPPFIKAQQLKASGKDIANNRIELKGTVSVELPKSGSLTADTAVVTLRNRGVTRAQVKADAPDRLVEFQHRAKGSDKLVRGRAASIDYDVEKSSLHLSGNVWFSDERGEWTMDQLDYNIATEAWRGTNTKATLNRRPKLNDATNDNP